MRMPFRSYARKISIPSKTDAQLLDELLVLLREAPRIQGRNAEGNLLPGTRVLEIRVTGRTPWNVMVDAGRLRESVEQSAQQIFDLWSLSGRR